MITLGDDPFSAEYFERFAALTESIGPLLDGDAGPYCLYWLYQRKKLAKADVTSKHLADAANMAECHRKLAISIRDEGYDKDRWKTCGRQLDPDKGQGPITVNIGADGTIYSWDGLHRSAILKHLGLPVEAEVYKRDPRWVELSEFHKTLYQPYPHPDFAGRKITRPGTERYEPIATWLKAHDIIDPLFVGACTGAAVVKFRDWGFQAFGIEPHKDRFPLAESWTRRVCPASIVQVAAHDFLYGNYGAVIGLSVYHHVATSLEKWREVCKLLVACPVHIFELAGKSEKQWHDKFKSETDEWPGGAPLCAESEMLYATCDENGGTSDGVVRERIYTDHTYASRQTIVLSRRP